ncbi:MAG: Na/Pi symporter [Bacteroidota bacterium]
MDSIDNTATSEKKTGRVPSVEDRFSEPTRTILRVTGLIMVLLLFFISLDLMSSAFKFMGSGFAENLLATTASPLIGLMTGILATSLVQSSSTVTSLTVALVASGALPIQGAVPIVMGANVGTTVTNTIVSMGHITRKNEFMRAMAGATVHDFFNFAAVMLLFPLEVLFGIISKPAIWLASGITTVGGAELFSPLKAVVKPIAGSIIAMLGEVGWLILIVGLLLLFLALRYLVVMLKKIMMGRTERILHKYIFGAPMAAMACGVVLTVLVQSSSVTTSVIVPMVGAGILTVRQVFPYTLGANVGTTVTALLASLALAADNPETGIAAITVALAHLIFNLFGIIVIYGIPPIREIPIKMAEWMGQLAGKNRLYAFLYLISIFFLLPLLLEFIF